MPEIQDASEQGKHEHEINQMLHEYIGARSDHLVTHREADVCAPGPAEIEAVPNREREPCECHSYTNEPDQYNARKKLGAIAEFPYQKQEPTDPNSDHRDVGMPVTFGLNGR